MTLIKLRETQCFYLNSSIACDGRGGETQGGDLAGGFIEKTLEICVESRGRRFWCFDGGQIAVFSDFKREKLGFLGFYGR